jgi:hypothetical protein
VADKHESCLKKSLIANYSICTFINVYIQVQVPSLIHTHFCIVDVSARAINNIMYTTEICLDFLLFFKRHSFIVVHVINA